VILVTHRYKNAGGVHAELIFVCITPSQTFQRPGSLPACASPAKDTWCPWGTWRPAHSPPPLHHPEQVARTRDGRRKLWLLLRHNHLLLLYHGLQILSDLPPQKIDRWLQPESLPPGGLPSWRTYPEVETVTAVDRVPDDKITSSTLLLYQT